MKKVYIVFPCEEASGAEKRFFEIWHNLQEKYPIYFITNKKNLVELISQLKIDSSIYKNKKLILYTSKKKNLINQFLAIYKINKKIDKKSIIHFPTVYIPLLSSLRDSNFIMSWVAPYKPINLKILTLKMFFLTFISFFYSFKIDVLNHSNYFFLSKNFLFKKKLSLTIGGSFSNPKIYKPKKKLPQIIFSGRLVPEKGIIEFIRSIIYLKKITMEHKIRMPNIVILGRGILYNKIKKIINHNDYKDINIKIIYTNEPWKYLSVSKIFISLQKYSNYPSQSLIESMLCGCVPIMTDSVDSKKMISNELSFFINNNLNYYELCETIIKILKYSDDKFYGLSNKIREFTISEFNINNQINYFKDLYWNENYFNQY